MNGPDIAILGSGPAGLSLAQACAGAGLDAIVCEPDPHARDRGEAFARKDNAGAAAQLRFADRFYSARTASVVFDALEPSEREILQFTPDPQALVATPYAVPPAFGRPAQAVRLVPFQPMHLRQLTELMRFPATSDAALARAEALCDRIGRVPVILPQGAQSAGLRLLDRLHRIADDLLLQGAVLWELDEAMTGFGFDLGLYEAQDLTGLDVAYARRKAQNATSLIADRAVEEGRIGKKIGWGWYRYPGGGGAVIDPLIEDLIREEAWFAKTPQRSFSDAEIIEHLISALRAEALAILSADQIGGSADLISVLVHGLGFPEYRIDMLDLPRRSDQRGSSAG